MGWLPNRALSRCTMGIVAGAHRVLDRDDRNRLFPTSLSLGPTAGSFRVLRVPTSHVLCWLARGWLRRRFEGFTVPIRQQGQRRRRRSDRHTATTQTRPITTTTTQQHHADCNSEAPDDPAVVVRVVTEDTDIRNHHSDSNHSAKAPATLPLLSGRIGCGIV